MAFNSLVIEFCERHLERLMARKGQQTRQERLFRSAQRFHLVPEKIDHHVVGIAPFRSRGVEPAYPSARSVPPSQSNT